VAVVWLTATAVGMLILWHYAGTSGRSAEAPEHWPGSDEIALNADHDTLVMFVHPHCPCTRASIAELQRIVAHCNGGLTPWIVFYKPSDADERWEQTDLWRSAAEVPGVHLVSDPDARLAVKFGAATSGSTVLYDPHGHLLFNGGITSARGHQGDNVGESAVIDLATEGNAKCSKCEVFGCPIMPTPTPLH
jgi:hypothetical protein